MAMENIWLIVMLVTDITLICEMLGEVSLQFGFARTKKRGISRGTAGRSGASRSGLNRNTSSCRRPYAGSLLSMVIILTGVLATGFLIAVAMAR